MDFTGFPSAARYQALSSSQVTPARDRCVQCGICSYSCPLGIDVRRFAWLEQPIRDSRCLTCGECISRCPRGVLSFEPLDFLAKGGRR